MTAHTAHVFAAIVAGSFAIVWLVWFAIWLLDQLGEPRRWLGSWRTTDGRMLVQFIDNGQERYAVGSGDDWCEAHAAYPSAWPVETIRDESTVRYLHGHWALEEQLKRERDAARARRALKWAKQSKASSEQSQVESEEPSASWAE